MTPEEHKAQMKAGRMGCECRTCRPARRKEPSMSELSAYVDEMKEEMF